MQLYIHVEALSLGFTFVWFAQSVNNIIFSCSEYVELRSIKTQFAGSFAFLLSFEKKKQQKAIDYSLKLKEAMPHRFQLVNFGIDGSKVVILTRTTKNAKVDQNCLKTRKPSQENVIELNSCV